MIEAWRFWGIGAASAWAAGSGAAFADIRIGLAAGFAVPTVPTASIACSTVRPGLHETNLSAPPPNEIGERAAGCVAFGDPAESAHGINHACRFASENRGDALIRSTVFPCSPAIGGIVAPWPARAISSAATAASVESFDAKRVPGLDVLPDDIRLSIPLVRHGVAKRDMKTVALVGFNGAYSENSLTEFGSAAAERVARGDMPATRPALRATRKQPDEATPAADAYAGAGVPGASPGETLRAMEVRSERSAIRQRAHGIAIDAFFQARSAGRNGARPLAAPIFVIDQFHPDSHADKPRAPACRRAREGGYGVGAMPIPGEHARDVAPHSARAVPVEPKHGWPGMPASRDAASTSFGMANGVADACRALFGVGLGGPLA
ncbi:hypothetical protein GTH10_10300 [Burkholderia thailandensis]|uniref:hypothetical protein n=1 Tax=Burkholderia thailandensis TaxID=57975 RepID=UPI00148ED458|nr:hypothetical protein [Burkholderia thailandensis]NOK47754.1 hypothetical protein [Burkholderia thailandensis]